MTSQFERRYSSTHACGTLEYWPSAKVRQWGERVYRLARNPGMDVSRTERTLRNINAAYLNELLPELSGDAKHRAVLTIEHLTCKNEI